MCGITGFLYTDNRPAEEVFVRLMSEAVAHRGPDGKGEWTEGAVALGHRRLAIIDLTPAGKQPMISANNRFVISYNGEVYNYKQLRAELEAKGYWFHSNTDTEVVLNSFVEWGVDALNRFNGMFAFAIWDRKQKELTLARDRYGIKPLYYSIQGASIYFGSEIKALLAHPEFTSGLDKEALLEYFTFQNFFTDRTLHQCVRTLPPGHYLQFGPNKERSVIHTPVQYWDYNFSKFDEKCSEEEYLEELDRLMVQAVNRQLVADVAVSSFLSGGMDSGTITALAAKQLPYMCTFTVGFDLSSASGLELGFDEREKAEHMSYHFKTEHYEMVLKSGDMERCISDLVWHLEEPRVGQSYPNWYAFKLASRFAKVVLAGPGGDELFGGYPWRYYRAAVNNSFEHYIDQYYLFWNRLIPNTAIHKVFAPIWGEVKHVWTRDIMRNVFAKFETTPNTAEDYINHSLYFEAKTFLHGLFIVEDKLSMAHSVETRLPFMDNDLVDFSMRVPVTYKLGNLKEIIRINENEPAKQAQYFSKTRDGKLILRKAMGRYIPKEVSERVKQGFSAPDASWFKGESIEYVKNIVHSSSSRIYDYFDKGAVRSLVDEHLQGISNRRLFIWSLIYFESWLQRFA